MRASVNTGPKACVAMPATGAAELKQIGTWSREARPPGPVCQTLTGGVGGTEGVRVLTRTSVGVCNLLANFKLDKLVSRRSRVQAGTLSPFKETSPVSEVLF